MICTYIHGSSPLEQERLELQHRLLGRASFLEDLRPGMEVLDLGCGTGAVSREIAAKIAPGIAVGMDRARAHVRHLKRLNEQGLLELYGPFPGHKGGMVILRTGSEEEARRITDADPFVSSGAETYELRMLAVSCRENNHLGMG